MTEPDWKDVEEWARGYIEGAYLSLEHPQSEQSSNLLRGQIKAMRVLIDHFTKPRTDPEKKVQPASIGEFVGPEY